jgi:protocatechuate 3,4-dioxygenase beta subunit
MNRKNTFSIVLTLSMSASTASTNPQATEPASTSNTAPNVPASTVDTPVSMDPSLACSGDKTTASTTRELTEGPYYTDNTPERANLYEAGMPGTKLVITGYVYDTNCQPVANAWLDFWQADATGEYDITGYTLRGHQFTDANGFYTLTTVVPGIYPGRTEHIHFKVQAPNGQVITSQLFFPGVAQNESDGIFDASLLLPIQETSAGLLAQFNFVVSAP